MESAIRLCCSPMPSAPLRLSSGAIGAAAARSSRFHLRLSHESLCLSHLPTHHPVLHPVGHVNCMLDRFSVPSKHEESDRKILRGVTGISLVLACVVGLCNFSIKMNPKFNTAHAALNWPPRPSPPTARMDEDPEEKALSLESVLKNIYPDISNLKDARPLGGQLALRSLWKMITPGKETPDQIPDEANVEELKLHAARLTKSGKPDEAVKMLKRKIERARKENRSMDEIRLEMALIELLLVQGKYDKAQRRADKNINDLIFSLGLHEDLEKAKIGLLLSNSDSFSLTCGPLLYQAIVHTMLGHENEAEKWTQGFKETLPKS